MCENSKKSNKYKKHTLKRVQITKIQKNNIKTHRNQTNIKTNQNHKS